MFDVLRTCVDHPQAPRTMRELAGVCRLSFGATRRALHRLRGAHLVRWCTRGRGRYARTAFEVRWKTPEASRGRNGARFPQVNDPPAALDNARVTLAPGIRGVSPSDGRGRPSHALRPAPSSVERARRWACARIRAEVRTWPIPGERRERIIAGVSWALTRALREGAIQPGPELGRTVNALIGRLRVAEEISHCLRAAHAYGAWAVRSVQLGRSN